MAAAALALAALAGGCGGDDPDARSATVPGRTLTLYSSLPKSGPSAPMARAVLAGQQRALAAAGGRAGPYKIKLVELDSSRPGDGAWAPSQIAKGVGRAADDPTAIAYLGELDLGASAISLPVTSSKGILQVSPADELTSLTRIPPGRPRATPERLYPEGVPNFVRLVPHDLLQARVLVRWARDRGARRIWIVKDTGVYGDELAAQAAFVARRSGMTVLGDDLVPDPEDAPELGRSILAERPDAVLYTGDLEDGTPPLLDALTSFTPSVPVFGSSALTQAPRAVDGVSGELHGVKPAFPVARYPAAGRRMLRRIAREDRESARVEALYGYESVALVLDAIKAAGSDRLTRAAVRRAALAPRLRRSPALGAYRINPRGEVSSRGFAGYLIRGGELHSPTRRPPAG